MKLQMDVDNNIENHIIFNHLESTIAVRCLARNDMGAVSREIKLVSNGKRAVFVSLEISFLILGVDFIDQPSDLKCCESL